MILDRYFTTTFFFVLIDVLRWAFFVNASRDKEKIGFSIMYIQSAVNVGFFTVFLIIIRVLLILHKCYLG